MANQLIVDRCLFHVTLGASQDCADSSWDGASSEEAVDKLTVFLEFRWFVVLAQDGEQLLASRILPNHIGHDRIIHDSDELQVVLGDRDLGIVIKPFVDLFTDF